MAFDEDITRFILNFAAENREQLEASADRIRRNADPVVNYLKSDDPMQYVVRGLLLCEAKMKELVAKHILDADIKTPKFVTLLSILRISGFLDGSEIPPYKKLNDLRNKVAHQLDYQVTPIQFSNVVATENSECSTTMR